MVPNVRGAIDLPTVLYVFMLDKLCETAGNHTFWTAHKDIHYSSLHATETKVILLEFKSNTHVMHDTYVFMVAKRQVRTYVRTYVLLGTCKGSMQQANANIQLTPQDVLPSPSQTLHVPKWIKHVLRLKAQMLLGAACTYMYGHALTCWHDDGRLIYN